MPVERFANSAQTTLNTAVSSGGATIVVDIPPVNPFPTQPQFRILVDSELMLVTAISGTSPTQTWTVTRNIENSLPAAVAHDSGALVTQVMTAGAVTNLDASFITSGSFAVGRLPSLSSGELWLGNGSNAATAVALSGDITVSNAGVTAIGSNKVTNAMLRQSGALSVVGRSANSAGNVADISATAATDAVLRESGSALGFGTVATGGLANDAVTDAKLRNSAALSVIGRTANSTGDPADIAASAGGDGVLRESGSSLGFGTIKSSAVTAAGCRVYNSADLTLTSGSNTALTFDSERFDTDGFHSTASNTSRITIPAGMGGYYLIGANVRWDTNTTSFRSLQVKVNGSTVIVSSNMSPASNGVPEQGVNCIYLLSAGDYIEVFALQNTGGNLAVKAFGGYSPDFWAMRLGV